MKVILHIGHPKTGTSFLQNVFALNADALYQSGINYPMNFVDSGYYDFEKLAKNGKESAGNGMPFFDLLSDDSNREKLEKVIEQHILSSELEVTLLSSELFFYYPERVVRLIELLFEKGVEVNIVAFIPTIYQAVINSYLQNIRNHGFYGDILKFVWDTKPRNYFKFRYVLDGIHGAAKKMVFPYLKEGVSGKGILFDFFSYVLAWSDSRILKLKKPKPVNVSLSAEKFELIRFLNALGMKDEVRKVIDSGFNGGGRAFDYYMDDAMISYIQHNFGDEMDLVSGVFDTRVSEDALIKWFGFSRPDFILLRKDVSMNLLKHSIKE